MKKLFLLAFLLIAFGFSKVQLPPLNTDAESIDVVKSQDVILDAFENQLSDIQVHGTGTVIRILPDDLEGNRHQRFIIQLKSGQTLLIAHNIDLAPRIKNLNKGDPIEFYGEYEWSHKGGVIHWTHLSPSGNHEDGYLKHNGTLYN